MSNDPTGEILLHPNTDEFNESDFINELVNRERRVKENKLENDFRNNLMANLYSTIDYWMNHTNGNVSTTSNSILTSNSVAINSTQDEIKMR